MANEIYESQKVALRFSKAQIKDAARKIRHGCTGVEREDAIEKIQNFREVHLYPLMLMKNHLARTSKKINHEIIVARRLKRLPTIINKLERPTLDGVEANSIQLTRMQDIGGCRAIVKDLKQLNALKTRLENSRSVHKITHISNYLTPKESGYGGVHLIYSCFDNADSSNAWRKTKIEIQLRTNLQHAWATSLEIIDTLENIDLKTSMDGHQHWRRFFHISGMLVAHDEGASILSSIQLYEYQKEMLDLERRLSVISKLTKFSVGISATTEHIRKLSNRSQLGMCLITLKMNEFINASPDSDNKVKVKLGVTAFKINDAQLALNALNESEKDSSIALSVLLSASNASLLKKAYPNYFGSTQQFSKFIRKHTRAVIK
ncbi:MAG: RelA/SpoT domain-containing protein [Shewanella sp.]